MTDDERKDLHETGWFRVFGTNDVQPEPAALLEELQRRGFDVTGRFRGDEQGWFAADIAYAAGAPPLHVERYLATEEGIRAELNAWAAWLEAQEEDPHALPLMKHMVRTRQLFTLPQGVDARPISTTLCQFLARQTEGVYQVDEAGFFSADGHLLLRKEGA